MNQIVNKFLLAGDKFMSELHLKQPTLLDKPGLTYSACGPFTKHKQRIQKLMQPGDTNYIYRNDLDKACFARDAAYSDSKDLTKRTAGDKALRDKAYNIAGNLSHNGYEISLASLVYKFLDRKTKGSGIKNGIKENQQLANEDNIWGCDLADMQLINKYNKRIRYLLCCVDIFSKYAWVVPFTDTKRNFYCY